jgi:hypothetical protein
MRSEVEIIVTLTPGRHRRPTLVQRVWNRLARLVGR